MMSDILETMHEYAKFAETKSEREAFEAVIDEITTLRARLAAVTAERDRMQHCLDAAYNVIDKDIKNDMAFAEKHADLWLENERLREALQPFAKLKPVSWSLKNDHYFIDTYDIRRARAAIEGAKEPAKGVDLGQ